MKKSSLVSLYAYLNGENVTNIDEIRAEIGAEIEKDASEKREKMAIYEDARPIVLNAIDETPRTLNEILERCVGLPIGFTKGRLQYAITHYWSDDVKRIESAKGANTYVRA